MLNRNEELKPYLVPGKHVHLVGIGGVSMRPLGLVLQGMGMLLTYSLGLGIPFIMSAVLIDYMKSTFDWFKRHYRGINMVCGALLILLGVAMATGLLGRWMTILS